MILEKKMTLWIRGTVGALRPEHLRRSQSTQVIVHPIKSAFTYLEKYIFPLCFIMFPAHQGVT